VEHRSTPRVRSVLKAEIRYNDGMMSVPCVVRDISETGARLDLSGDVALPDRFDLFIEKRHRTRRALVKRRHGRDVGVAFDDALGSRALPEAALTERVERLECEIDELRSVLGELAAALQLRH